MGRSGSVFCNVSAAAPMMRCCKGEGVLPRRAGRGRIGWNSGWQKEGLGSHREHVKFPQGSSNSVG